MRAELMATPLDQLYDLKSLKAAGDDLAATLKNSFGAMVYFVYRRATTVS